MAAVESSFDSFSAQCTRRVEKLVRCAQLLGVENSSSALQLLSGISDEVTELEELATAQREAMERDRAVLKEMQDLALTAQQMRQELEHASQNLPQHLPALAEGAASKSSSVSSTTSHDDEVAALTSDGRYRVQPQLPSTSHETTSAGTTAVSRKVSAATAHAKALPALAYITLVEFNAVPKYIRGRLAYDSVNIAVEELNRAFEIKYKLIAVPRGQLSDAEIKKRKAYKAQEIKEVDGRHFVTDHDIRTTTSLKLDSTGRAVLALLRHCHRLREVHGGGFVRYAIQT